MSCPQGKRRKVTLMVIFFLKSLGLNVWPLARAATSMDLLSYIKDKSTDEAGHKFQNDFLNCDSLHARLSSLYEL